MIYLNNGPTIESEKHILKVLVLIDATKSMGKTLDKTKNSVGKMIEEAKNSLGEDLFLMKIAGYRNY